MFKALLNTIIKNLFVSVYPFFPPPPIHQEYGVGLKVDFSYTSTYLGVFF